MLPSLHFSEIRKIRKKLRQIEALEVLHRELNSEEAEKLSHKAHLRAQLAELLAQQQRIVDKEPSKEEQTEQLGFQEKQPEDTTQEPMKRIYNDSSSGMSEDKTSSPESRLAQDLPAKQAKLNYSCETQSSTSSFKPKDGPSDFGFASLKRAWEATQFRIRLLKGHSDIITCVGVLDNYVISGSRDTTLKVWHVPTMSEEKNLGGHTGGVTCLTVLPKDYCKILANSLDMNSTEKFVVSGSVDCSLIVWALSTGHSVQSIYTFSAVSALCFLPHKEMIASGSDGGKIDVWDLISKDHIQSLRAHDDLVSTLQPHGPLLFTGSWDGSVKVWECEGESTRSIPLRHLRTCDILGHLVSVRSLSARGEIVYVGTNRASIQVLQWKTGAISKLTNHSTESGVTDCVCQTRDGLLLSSGFDLDTGSSFLNLRSLPDDSYLATLCWPTASRILCVATWLTSSGGHRWITGGEELIVWEQLPANTKDKSDVTVTRMSSLDHKPVDTGSEGETELSYDEEDVEEEEEDDFQVEQDGSRSYCILL
uniref:F-box/WD repeat-containing protein 7-like n=1 Tax=Erpetoichthys calabaricus TaxID=27687 RepID=A0A8C4T922_ERPCA